LAQRNKLVQNSLAELQAKDRQDLASPFLFYTYIYKDESKREREAHKIDPKFYLFSIVCLFVDFFYTILILFTPMTNMS
jgi:hypothetical protein